MIKVFSALCFVCSFVSVNAQFNPDKEQIQWSVDRFIEGINNSDTIALRQVVDPNIGLLTIFNDGKKNIMAAETIEMLFDNVIKPRTEEYREDQESCLIESNGILASVWCDYIFYVDNKILHCGVNAYQLYKTRRGWKIIQITDTRQKHDCGK